MESIGDLELDQDLPVQKRAWRVERVGWAVIAVIVVLALLGLFSTGPLSSATAGNLDEGIEITYQRFLRNEGEASLEILIAPDQIKDGKIELWIDAGYLEHSSQLVIQPDPDEIRLDDGRQIFVFLADPNEASIMLSVSFQPEVIGRLPGKVGIVDGPTISFWQFSYP